MKKKLLCVLIIAIIIVSILLVVVNKNDKKEEVKSEVESIQFVISGDRKGSYYSYSLEKIDSLYFIRVIERKAKNSMQTESSEIIDEKTTKKIIDLCNKLDPVKWSTYDKTDMKMKNVNTIGTTITLKNHKRYYKEENVDVPRKEKKIEQEVIKIIKSYSNNGNKK